MHIADISLGADNHPAASGGISALNTVFAQNDTAGGEIRPFDKLGQFFNGCVRVIDEVVNTFAHFGEIMRRDIGSHTDGNAGTAVNQEIG